MLCAETGADVGADSVERGQRFLCWNYGLDESSSGVVVVLVVGQGVHTVTIVDSVMLTPRRKTIVDSCYLCCAVAGLELELHSGVVGSGSGGSDCFSRINVSFCRDGPVTLPAQLLTPASP